LRVFNYIDSAPEKILHSCAEGEAGTAHKKTDTLQMQDARFQYK
jgi:hypothetical protein